MNELKITSSILILTILAIGYALFSQPNLKQVVWKRGEKRFIYGQIEQAVAKKPGELNLLVRLKQGKIYLVLPQISPLAKCAAGNTIKAAVKLYPIQPGFNGYRELYDYLLYRRGILARSWLSGDFRCDGAEVSQPLRLRIFEYFRKLFGDTDQLSLIFAINFGAGELIGENIKELFRELGLSHALVVSGFHVGLVYSITFLLLDFLISRSVYLLCIIPSEFLAAPLALLTASYFSVFSGFAMPCVRAILFLFVNAFYKIIGSSASSLHRVLMTFCLIVFFDPSSFFDLSLLLSVAAVVGVLCGLRVQSIAESYMNRFARIIGAFAINFFAWCFTLPICLVFFGQIFITAPLHNFILLPLITVFFSCVGCFAILLGLIGISCFNYAVGLILLILGHFLGSIWKVNEFMPIGGQALEFEQATYLAILVILLDAYSLFILYSFSTKPTDEFQQLARA